MEAKLKNYLANWHFMRILRLAIGLYVAYEAINAHLWSYGVIATLFLFQAVTNTGCSSGCYVPTSNNSAKKDIKFEEITK